MKPLYLILVLILIGVLNKACGSTEIKNIIRQVVNCPGKEGIFIAMAYTESRFNPHVEGLHGEVGLFQVKLSTAKSLNCAKTVKELKNPIVNTRCALAYWKKLEGEWESAERIIYAYNFGSENAKKYPLRSTLISDSECIGKNRFKAKCHLKRVMEAYYNPTLIN